MANILVVDDELGIRALLPRLRVMEWRAPAEQLMDLDTAAELSAARSRATDEQGATMQD